jgi:hypothetical protein
MPPEERSRTEKRKADPSLYKSSAKYSVEKFDLIPTRKI